MKFVNLYTETEYSLLSSPNKIDELVNKACEYHYDALAITDYNNMYGAIKFYSACKEKGIKPIFGLHFDVNDIDMIREFNSYAMENSVDELKSMANGIVSDVTELIAKEL